MRKMPTVQLKGIICWSIFIPETRKDGNVILTKCVTKRTLNGSKIIP